MVESGPGIVKPTETLDLTCKVTGASLTDGTNMYSVHWVRQLGNKQMEWLSRFDYDEYKNYASSVQGRLTLSRDTNKGEVYFKLTGMKPEESGVTSQITMVESGLGIVKPTETLDLTCKVTGASLTDSTNMYGVHWVRQSEENSWSGWG
uniref:Ig-like domain-containing protein n=1 Tax=Pyxicephalus adspersus TaxID=30357 RepID=A0AAV2ZVH4_PYXAD|nr:TPA: hypothetical protein GDO54_013548 [Pyxicephalus adspersus]